MLFASGGVFKEYLDYSFDTVEKQYGSFTEYIKTALAVTDNDLALLREKYTE